MAQRPHDAAVDIIGHAGNALSSIVQVLEAFGPIHRCWPAGWTSAEAARQDLSYQERPISTLCFNSSMSNLRWACSRHPLEAIAVSRRHLRWAARLGWPTPLRRRQQARCGCGRRRCGHCWMRTAIPVSWTTTMHLIRSCSCCRTLLPTPATSSEAHNANPEAARQHHCPQRRNATPVFSFSSSSLTPARPPPAAGPFQSRRTPPDR